MTRETLDKKIKDLNNQVLVMESMVRQAALDGVSALMNKDATLAKEVYLNDAKINDLRFSIEKDSLVVIATQQPLAIDLRVLSSILEVSIELERMGDYAKGIARINMMIGDQAILPPLADLPMMAQITTKMLTKSINAFINQDLEAARVIPKEDDKVDDLFNKIYHGLVKYMTSDPDTIDLANHLQWAVHNIERMADRVTNICERTIFIVTGEINELEESDDELIAH